MVSFKPLCVFLIHLMKNNKNIYCHQHSKLVFFALFLVSTFLAKQASSLNHTHSE